MGQHAFAPRRRDITVYRAEQERHRADEQAKDRLEIQERLASEAAAGIVQITPFKSTATPITTGAPKPTMATSISVPVPVVAPPPIIKLATTVAGLRISMPMTHGVTRAPVGRPSRPLPTPANTGSAAPPILSPSIPLAARTLIIPSSQVPQAVTAPSALTLPLPVEAPLLPSHLCSSYYVEPLGWMNDILETGILAGKIVCPNSKCSAKLGSFDWAGLRSLLLSVFSNAADDR
jgi:dual specificity phosphatase 12